MARTPEHIFHERFQGVEHVTFHNGIQIGNKVYNSINEVKHGAVMTSRYDGIKIEMNGDTTVVTVGNIHSYRLKKDDK
jgi:hypothetical protein